MDKLLLLFIQDISLLAHSMEYLFKNYNILSLCFQIHLLQIRLYQLKKFQLIQIKNNLRFILILSWIQSIYITSIPNIYLKSNNIMFGWDYRLRQYKKSSSCVVCKSYILFHINIPNYCEKGRIIL